MGKLSIMVLLMLLLFMSGCVNRRGISATYYNDCSEYYDARGYYHKVCDKNIIDYKDIKDGFYKEFGKKKPPAPNVWQ